MRLLEYRIDLGNWMTLQSDFFVVNFAVKKLLGKRMLVDRMMM